MLKRLSASALVLALLSSTAFAGQSSCFTPTEAKAAKFRAMQQDFNVAALNCQSADPNDPNPSIRDRYNNFIGRFGGTLQSNAHVLKAHFSRAGGSFDHWMTQVANDAGQRVMTDNNFCQTASDNLDKALAMPPQDVENFADGVSSAAYVPTCAEHTAPTKSHKAKAVHHPVKKKHHQPEKTAQSTNG